MKIKNFLLFSIAVVTAIIISINAILLTFAYFNEIVFPIKTLAILSAVLFVVLVIIISNGIEAYVNFRIDKIYKQIPSLTKRRFSNISADEFDFLKRDILKNIFHKKQEIQKLNSRENYRRDFLGNVAHELKTPLFTVQGYLLTLIEGAAEDPEIREKYLNRANLAITRLSDIVGDLDLITKLETNELKLKTETFDIIKVIQKVFNLLEMEASKRDIKLMFDKFYDIPVFVLADEVKIEQVLINLVMNSIKYGKIGGITTVCLKHIDDEKISIKVTDNGEGIKKEDVLRLFERFYRAEKSRSRDQGGSGLGLSIVKHIIEAHGQTINVKSKIGKGSKFKFTLEKS